MSKLVDAETAYHDGDEGVLFTIETKHYTSTGANAKARLYATSRFPINALSIDVLSVVKKNHNPPRRNKYHVGVFVPAEGIMDKLPVDIPGFD